ncbi:MAG: DUF932 domain-containing protein [Desulfuromonadaceae bacterium]|nr:DUF932 domain-containing protein [Desulfuromonadaceae bacterium]
MTIHTHNTVEIQPIDNAPAVIHSADQGLFYRHPNHKNFQHPHPELDDSPFMAVDKDANYTLGDAYDDLRAWSRHHYDRQVCVSEISLCSADSIKIGDQTHPLSTLASRALCARLGAPHPYIRTLPRYLQTINLNYGLLQHKEEKLFIRFDGNRIRGLLSNRYVPMDHVQILDALIKAGVDTGKRVQLDVDDSLMRLCLVDNQRTFEIGRDDPHTPGISIINSELGQSSFSIAPYVLRLICTNGLITRVRGTATNFRHVSDRALTQMPRILSIAYAQVDNQEKQLRIAMERPVEDQAATLKAIARHFSLTKIQRDAIDWALPYETGPNMFHVIQTLTKAAQYPELTTEQNTELQQVGGEVLRLVA